MSGTQWELNINYSIIPAIIFVTVNDSNKSAFVVLGYLPL